MKSLKSNGEEVSSVSILQEEEEEDPFKKSIKVTALAVTIFSK